MTLLLRALLPAFFCSTAAFAGGLDLQSYLNSVRAQNPSLVQAVSGSEARAAQLDQEAAWSNPTLSLQGGAKSSPDANGSVVGAGLSQGFLWPGKRAARRQLADVEREGTALFQKAVEADLVKQALLAALDNASAKLHWQAALDRQKHLEPVKAFLSSQTFASPQQKTDRDIVEARLRNQESERASLSVELEGSRSRLALLAGSANGDLDLDWALPGIQGVKAPELKRVLEGNPALKAVLLQERQAAAQRQLAEKAGMPDPELSVEYSREELGSTEQTVAAGLSLPLPVLNGNAAGKRSAASQVRAAEAQRQALQRALTLEVQAAVQKLKGLEAAAKAYPEGSSEKLEAGLHEAEKQLRVGRLALISYLEYEDEAARSREALLTIQLEQAKALVELNALAGNVEAPEAFVAGKGAGHAE